MGENLAHKIGWSSEYSGVKGFVYSKTLNTLDPHISLLCFGITLNDVT